MGKDGVGGCVKRVIYTLPVLFTWAFILSNAIVFGVSFLPKVVETLVERLVIGILIYSLLTILSLHFWRATMETPGRPSEMYHFPPDMSLPAVNTEEREAVLEKLAKSRGLVLKELSKEGKLRVCEQCRLLKPDRCHHCSKCGHCVLKFDHHCPFINNCVCYDNWKFFFLTLVWMFFVGLAAVPITLWKIIDWRVMEKWDVHMACLIFLTVSSFYCLGIVPFAGYILILMARNCTLFQRLVTGGGGAKVCLPTMKAPLNPYDLGWLTNLRQVLGSNPVLAILPVFTDQTDGQVFPRNSPKPSKLPSSKL